LFESAFLDGASNYDVFFYMVLPLSVPSLASLVIFQFMWVWNDLLVALIYLGGITRIGSDDSDYRQSGQLAGRQLAGAYSSCIYFDAAASYRILFGLQRYFVRGILAGSVKG
jgi:alpha-glucoside transport system permease protein